MEFNDPQDVIYSRLHAYRDGWIIRSAFFAGQRRVVCQSRGMLQRIRAHARRAAHWLPLALPALLLAACTGPEPAVSTAEQARRGAAIYAGCAPCHGLQGEGLLVAEAPRLAGREDWFLRKQIEDFRRRNRGKDDSKETGYLPPEARTQYMHPVAERLNRTDVAALLAHLNTLQPPPVPPALRGDASRGRTLFAACIECHGADAAGNLQRGAPRLTGQHDWYLFSQVRDFRMGWRGVESTDPHVSLMRTRLDLDDAALQDLAAYIVSLNPPAPSAPRPTP